MDRMESNNSRNDTESDGGRDSSELPLLYINRTIPVNLGSDIGKNRKLSKVTMGGTPSSSSTKYGQTLGSRIESNELSALSKDRIRVQLKEGQEGRRNQAAMELNGNTSSTMQMQNAFHHIQLVKPVNRASKRPKVAIVRGEDPPEEAAKLVVQDVRLPDLNNRNGSRKLMTTSMASKQDSFKARRPSETSSFVHGGRNANNTGLQQTSFEPVLRLPPEHDKRKKSQANREEKMVDERKLLLEPSRLQQRH